MGEMSAIKVVEEMKIQSHKEKDKLAKAKELTYKKGFYEGVMIVGVGNGKKVEEAKPIVRKHMIENNWAAPYYEPEDMVVSRSGDECVVGLCD